MSYEGGLHHTVRIMRYLYEMHNSLLGHLLFSNACIRISVSASRSPYFTSVHQDWNYEGLVQSVLGNKSDGVVPDPAHHSILSFDTVELRIAEGLAALLT